MKKFSKESMQNFMLLHAEKLILGGCIAATGLLIWSSLGGEDSFTKTPTNLKDEAKSAQVYINQDTWDVLEPFREGEADAKEKIEKAKRIDPDIYKFALIGNVAPATAPRQDPEIFAPEQLFARQFTAGILMDLAGVTTPLVGFPEAPKRLGADGDGFQGLQGGGGKGGGLDFGGGGGGGDFDRGELPEDFIPLDRSGVFNKENALTMQGIWPQAFSISPDKITTNVLDVVCVTAVVDMQKQAAAYEKAFGQSVAFNDKRDRPVYQFLQVQRREVSDVETEWRDISEDVTYNYPQQYPKTLVKMPFQLFRSAPEVVAPDNWDPIISQPIPAFVMLDYQKFASHPALKQRREFPEWQKPDEKRMMGGDENPGGGIFGGAKGGAARDKGFDAGNPGEDDGDRLRKGSETETYKDAIVERKPGGQYRLVRFFDLFLPTKASRSKTYEYRIRVWVGDPNQLDPTDGFHKNRGRTLAPDPTGEVKFAGDSSGDTGDFAASGMGDDADMSKGGDGEGFDSMKKEVVQDINKSMLVPPARKRINAATSMQETQERFEDAARKLHEMTISGRDKPDPDKKLMDPLYVAEFTESGELEKIELPPSTANYAYTQYLRFARPSPWSEPVRVTGTQSPSDVYAGQAVRERSVSMDAGAGEVRFEQAEPSIEVVVSSWIRSLGTKLPSKKKVYIGETLNFNKPAYVTHPVTWEILAAERPRSDEDDPKRFTLPFRTGSTIIDAFAGEELDLPNSKTLTMKTPTEVLIMDANGNMKVSNQFDAARAYRNEIAEPDVSRFYGKARKQRQKRTEEEEDFNFDEP